MCFEQNRCYKSCFQLLNTSYLLVPATHFISILLPPFLCAMSPLLSCPVFPWGRLLKLPKFEEDTAGGHTQGNWPKRGFVIEKQWGFFRQCHAPSCRYVSSLPVRGSAFLPRIMRIMAPTGTHSTGQQAPQAGHHYMPVYSWLYG